MVFSFIELLVYLLIYGPQSAYTFDNSFHDVSDMGFGPNITIGLVTRDTDGLILIFIRVSGQFFELRPYNDSIEWVSAFLNCPILVTYRITILQDGGYSIE